MSTIRQTPYIEELLASMSEQNLNDLKTILDSGGNNVNLDFEHLIADTYKNKVTPVYFKFEDNGLKTGILIWTDTKCALICYHRFQDLIIFELDPTYHTYEKIKQYCDINELRRVLDDTIEKTGAIDSGDADKGQIPVADGEGGVEWKDNFQELVLTNQSGTLTDDEIALAKEGNTVARLGSDGQFYYKDTQNNYYVIFKAAARVANDDTIVEKITIDLSDNTYSYSYDVVAAGESFTPTYDDELSDASTNAVQNKVVTNALNDFNIVKADVTDLQKEVFGEYRKSLNFEQGKYEASGGFDDDAMAKIRAEMLAGTYIITPSSDIYYSIVYYDTDNSGTSFVNYGSFVDTTTITLERKAYINVRYVNNAAITPDVGNKKIEVFENVGEPLEDLPYLMENRVAETKNKGITEVFKNLLGRTAYYVGVDKTYTTISGAITQWANDNYPPANIYISDGEYNEVVDLGSGHTISLMGQSKEGTIIRTKTGLYADAPIVVGHGNVNIENLTVIADHSADENFDYETVANPSCAYGIHIDGGSVAGLIVVKNCKIVSYQSPALGTGLIPNATIRIEDCECYCYTDFTSNTTTKQYTVLKNGCLLCHLSSSSLYPDRGTETLQLVNSKFYAKNTENVIRLKYGDVLTEKMNVLALNNTLSSSKEDDRNKLFIPDTNLVNLNDNSQGNTCKKMNK